MRELKWENLGWERAEGSRENTRMIITRRVRGHEGREREKKASQNHPSPSLVSLSVVRWQFRFVLSQRTRPSWQQTLLHRS